jgi:hypothetical protein
LELVTKLSLMKIITKLLFIRFKETDVRLQQETLGILGVNLIYGAYYKYNDPKRLLLFI